MAIRILYFAWVREKIGKAEELVEVPEEVDTVAGLIGWLSRRDARCAEAFANPGVIRAAVDRSISGHAAKVEADIAEAMKKHRLHADWTAKDLALHTQAVLQGAFVLAKAKGGAEVAADSIDHLRRYVELLFNRKGRKPTRDRS